VLPCNFVEGKLSLSLFNSRNLPMTNSESESIQVHLLAPAVCKVHSSNTSCHSLWNCCQRK